MASQTRIEPPDRIVTLRHHWIFRHPLVIRVAHWINVVCLAVLLMSGLQIFNAHPALYWGQASHFDTPFLAITEAQNDVGETRGVVKIGGLSFDTTGWLGVSTVNGEERERAFPSWITLPSNQDLGTGRRWHFLFAWAFVINGLIYLAYGIGSGQLRRRIVPEGDQVRTIGASIKEHFRLHFPEGDEARRYNVLQKLTYLVVVLVLLPLMLLTGISMSPGMNAAFPWLLDLFGGRQSARSIHFIVVNLLVLFVIVHVVLVIVSGLWNNLRSMVTGWYVIETRRLPESGGTR